MKTRNKVLKIVLVVVMILLSLFFLFPVVWMIANSFKPDAEITADMNSVQAFIPPTPSGNFFDNYISVITDTNFLIYMGNTLLYAAVLIVLGIIVNGLAGYALAKIKFPFADKWLLIIMMLMIIPSETIITINFLFIAKMGLLNTIPALFIPNLFSACGTFLLRQFFMALPDEIEDAARLDGCNHFMIYSRIMLPLIRSGLVALGILTLRFAWNDLMWPLIVNTSTEKMTLSAGLSFMQGQYATDYPTMMAGAVMAVLPLLILFAIFQKQFIEGVAMSGIKG